MAATGLFLVALAVTGWISRPEPQRPAAVMRFTIPVDLGTTTATFSYRQIAISPDGSRLAYAVVLDGPRFQIHLRQLDQLDGTPLPGSDSGVGPFFSPDGEWVGFQEFGSRTLKKVPIAGGPAVRLGDPVGGVQVFGASWGVDGQIVFGQRGGGLFRIAEGGGNPEAVTTLDAGLEEGGHYWPFIIPGTNAVLFVIAPSRAQPVTGELAVAALDTGEVTRLGLAGTSPRYIRTGHLVFVAEDGSLRAVPFDTAGLEVTGNPVAMAEGVQVRRSGAANFDVSDTGLLVLVPGGLTELRRSLVWVDRAGVTEPIDVPPRAYTYARLSPDGRRIALDSRDEEDDIWIWDVERESLQRFTQDPGRDRIPLWTPDGARLVFLSELGGAESLHWQAADGSGTPEQLVTLRGSPNSFTPNGARLLFGSPDIKVGQCHG